MPTLAGGLPALKLVQRLVELLLLYGGLVAGELKNTLALSASRTKVRPSLALSASLLALIFSILFKASRCLRLSITSRSLASSLSSSVDSWARTSCSARSSSSS